MEPTKTMDTDEADAELKAAKEASVVGTLHRGAEVLLYDGDPRVRDGFRKLLKSAGLVVTATDDADLAQSLASDKHFAVAIVDLDTPEIDGGLALLSALQRLAPATSVVLLTARQIFSVAVKGFRRGARDVIAKSPENVRYLTDVVVRECHARDRIETRETLLAEVMEVHEAFLERLMEASKAKAEAEERNSGSSVAVDLTECVVLVADGNPNTSRGLEEALSADEGYKFISVLTGGEALDKVGQTPFQLALVSSDLPDLPSSIIAKSLRAESAEGIVLLFSHPEGNKPGRADIIEPSQSIELIPELRDGAQLVEQIHELRKAYVAKARERHYLRVFRRDHYDFLRRYVEVRQKLLAAKPEAKEQ